MPRCAVETGRERENRDSRKQGGAAEKVHLLHVMIDDAFECTPSSRNTAIGVCSIIRQ